LREFYRHDEAEELRIPVDVNELVQQAILLTQPRWQTEATAGGRAIAITAEAGEVPCISGDATELRAVLINLIFNAVDALPEGGAIHIRTAIEGDAVVLKISDSGVGMSEEVRKRCLEPFFSTKGKAGTGLGLSMVFGIIERHAGSIAIESALGKGTTFALRLPLTAPEDLVMPETLPSSNGPLSILVVDDQPILSELLARCLQDDLHTVETAISGSDALEKFRAADFDLVITDHVMAEMTGERLAIAIKELNPKVPVILLTGYAGDPTDEKQHPEVIDLVLRKPLSRASLRRALSKVIAGNCAIASGRHASAQSA
jgi:CheY-like chemotaxis protein